ncbi:hypothetical protein Sango_1811500 [Sesamum angolense]|uniref:Transmembrane protein 33 homolog n=1 Tax=Sesamum angolense TaxID=2727404 RepID=A0AAE2BPV0_9LAMI|nr:hypothetical protein Sango_1811500 [Sesamum angolense]
MGGGDGDDPQKLKRMAAAAYDYDNDPRWADYWSNVLIPPHMASRSDVVNHFKHKFYQRYIDRDLIVEPIGSQVEHQGHPQLHLQHHCAGIDKPFNFLSMLGLICNCKDQEVFLVAVLAVLPVVPKNLSYRAYRLSFLGTACSSLYSLYSLYGKPRAWNLQALQVWFQSVLVTKDFIYSMFCLSFVTSHLCLKYSNLLLLITDTCNMMWYLCKTPKVGKIERKQYPRRKYLEETCVWVESNTTTLSILSSQAEIGIGFLLIISLFSPQRNIIQAFMYWQLLKLMYHAPATAGYHQSAWARIGRTVNPLIHRYAPFMNTPISSIQRWWFR